jgi:hypothetical protein
MNEPLVRRRDVLRAMTTGLVIAAAAPLDGVEAAPVSLDQKRKARYQPNSAEVQDFYRVNRYPAK